MGVVEETDAPERDDSQVGCGLEFLRIKELV